MTTEKEVLGAHGWPYGPDAHNSMRPLLLDWAALRGVRLASDNRDLARFVSCSWSEKPFGWRSHYSGTDAPYWDHVTYWIKDRSPALILMQPYDADRRYEEQARSEAVRLNLTLRVPEDHWYRFPCEDPATVGYEFWIQDPDA